LSSLWVRPPSRPAGISGTNPFGHLHKIHKLGNHSSTTSHTAEGKNVGTNPTGQPPGCHPQACLPQGGRRRSACGCPRQPHGQVSLALSSIPRPLFEPEPPFGSEPQGRGQSRGQTEGSLPRRAEQTQRHAGLTRSPVSAPPSRPRCQRPPDTRSLPLTSHLSPLTPHPSPLTSPAHPPCRRILSPPCSPTG